jgi:hypothetical protein
MLEGKKTYITAAALVVAVVVEKFLGFDVPGIVIDDNWMLVLANAVGLGTLRSAIK